MEERLTTNQEVVGSTPMWPSLFAFAFGLMERKETKIKHITTTQGRQRNEKRRKVWGMEKGSCFDGGVLHRMKQKGGDQRKERREGRDETETACFSLSFAVPVASCFLRDL